MYNDKTNNNGNGIDMNDFVKHFQNLSNTPHFSSFTYDDDSVNSDSIVDVEQ